MAKLSDDLRDARAALVEADAAVAQARVPDRLVTEVDNDLARALGLHAQVLRRVLDMLEART